MPLEANGHRLELPHFLQSIRSISPRLIQNMFSASSNWAIHPQTIHRQFPHTICSEICLPNLVANEWFKPFFSIKIGYIE